MTRNKAIPILLWTAVVALMAVIFAFSAQPAPESYSIHVPGEGMIGDYSSVQEAETALHYLPYSARQRATICDQDGVCVCR